MNQNHLLSSNQTTGRRPERLAARIDFLLPEDEDEEYSFEELRARKLGLYDYDWEKDRDTQDGDEESYCQTPPRHVGGSRTPIKVKAILSPSPNRGKIQRKARKNGSPTMTFHTKAATDEIYGLFNGPLGNASSANDMSGDSSDSDAVSEGDYTAFTQVEPLSEHSESDTESRPANETGEALSNEDDDADSVHSSWSDFTFRRPIEDEQGPVEGSSKLAKLSIFSDLIGERSGQTEGRKLQIPPPPVDFDPPTLPYHVAKDQAHMQSRLPYMTPIVERTESLPPTTLRRDPSFGRTPSRTKAGPLSEQILEESPGSFEVYSNARSPPSPVASRSSPKLRPNPSAASSRRPLGTKIVDNVPAAVRPIVDDTLCNPQDATLRSTIISKLTPPLKTYEGYYEQKYRKFAMSSEIKKYVKLTAAKRDGTSNNSNSSIPRPPSLEFVTGDGGSFYTVLKELGKGAFAPVFMVENNMVADAEDEADDMNDEPILDTKLAGRRRYEALKMEHPPSPWEFYIIRAARERLQGNRAKESIVAAHELHIFGDEGYLIVDYRDQGTILDIVNANRADSSNTSGAGLDETLAMFLTIEVLRTVEALHTAGIIHGDLKADNCLIRCEPTPDLTWNPRYRANGSEGWVQKGICLIDFGRGIDMKLFPSNVQFVADWKTDHQDCAEMREMRPWTWQVDYHGVAAIAYLMLFGRYIETVMEPVSGVGGRKRYRIKDTLKRYWQQDLWKEFFEVLLNPGLCVENEVRGQLPMTKRIRGVREKMEAWLEVNAERGVGLKNLVKKRLETGSTGWGRRR